MATSAARHDRLSARRVQSLLHRQPRNYRSDANCGKETKHILVTDYTK
jgi:hypothetical protein